MGQKLLTLSNGHGEDEVAVRILRELQQLEPELCLQALPIVGVGSVYRQADIELLTPVRSLPSGGFIYMDQRQLWQDIQSGLLAQTWQQLKAIRTWARSGGFVLAVGDIVPLAMAWWSGAPFAFVGTAKSEYYLRTEAPPSAQMGLGWRQWLDCVYLPWERWLMAHPHCRGVFPRDRLTAQLLQQWPIPVADLGNPMSDELEPAGVLTRAMLPPPTTAVILLLPGSRASEAQANWQLILQSLLPLIAQRPHLLFIAAIASQIPLKDMQDIAQATGWAATDRFPLSVPHHWLQRGLAHLLLVQKAFSDSLHMADLAIAMAGTATEQCVGQGKPVITFPGHGPQFTEAFAEAQSRLLGPSIHRVPQPQAAWTVALNLLDASNSDIYTQNGLQRMGAPGASRRIAQHLAQVCQAQ